MPVQHRRIMSPLLVLTNTPIQAEVRAFIGINTPDPGVPLGSHGFTYGSSASMFVFTNHYSKGWNQDGRRNR